MASYKETPRQKMIAMMYLVLTALLALNVSKEILDAFTVVNDSLESTNVILNNKSEDIFNDFRSAYQLYPEKVKPYWEKAQKAREFSNELTEYIKKIKVEIIAKTDGITLEEADTINLRFVESRDNFDIPTTYFIGQSQDGSAGKSRELRLKIEEFKKKMMELIDPDQRQMVKLGLETDGNYYDRDGLKQNWEMHYFYNTILAADVSLLNKLIADVRNAEIDIVSRLLNAISATDYKFEKVYATAVPKSNYVLLGSDFEADVFVSAYDTKNTPEVTGPFRKEIKQNGIVTIKAPTTKEGLQKIVGSVNLKGPDGKTVSHRIEAEFVVAKPTGTVAATKMNVLYIGVDNPVSISAPGVPDRDIIAEISAGKIERWTSPEEPLANFRVYNLPLNTGKAYITVKANVDGKIVDMGKTEYRIKSVPNFLATIDKRTQGLIDKPVLKLAGAIYATPPQEFEFKTKFDIKSFEMVTLKAGNYKIIRSDPDKKGRFTQEMLVEIDAAKKSQKFWFENIIAIGPDGKERDLNTISLTIR